MPTLKVRKDTSEEIVEVNTGDGWRGLTPDAARQMADSYEQAIDSGAVTDTSGTRTFVTTLREYADDLDNE